MILMGRACSPLKANSHVSIQGATTSKPYFPLVFRRGPDRVIVLASKSSVHFKNASDGREVELDVRGDWFDRSANVTFGGEPVAHISRSFFNVREIFADKDTVSRSCTHGSYSVGG